MPSWWVRVPTGLAAAITLARAGVGVEVFEGAPTVGGGTRTEALTLPGFAHDVCSAVHPSLVSSPFFRSLDLPALGIRLRQPEVAFAHPLDGGRAAALSRDVDETASHLGGDAALYRGLVGPLVQWLDRIVPYVLSPMRSIPSDPLALARFAWDGAPSVRHVAKGFYDGRGPGPPGRYGGPLDGATDRPTDCGLRFAAHRFGPRCRLAGGRGRECRHHARPGRRAAPPGRHRPYRPPDWLRSTSFHRPGPSCSIRHLASSSSSPATASPGTPDAPGPASNPVRAPARSTGR